MSETTRLKYLRIALLIFGLFFIFVLPVFMLSAWRSGWAWGWQDGEVSHYTYMVLAMYAVMGIFFLLAIRDPRAYASLIWYAVWSSVLHGMVMFYQALTDPAERGHLVGDVPALFILALVLGVLMPRSDKKAVENN